MTVVDCWFDLMLRKIDCVGCVRSVRAGPPNKEGKWLGGRKDAAKATVAKEQSYQIWVWQKRIIEPSSYF